MQEKKWRQLDSGRGGGFEDALAKRSQTVAKNIAEILNAIHYY